jgi:hypothetical protein
VVAKQIDLAIKLDRASSSEVLHMIRQTKPGALRDMLVRVFKLKCKTDLEHALRSAPKR